MQAGLPVAARRSRLQRADVPDQHRLPAGGHLSRPDGGVDAADDAGASDPGDADLHALRRAPTARRFTSAIPRPSASRDLTRPDFGDPVPIRPGEDPRLLGVRRHAAGGRHASEAADLHHAQAGAHVRHRLERRGFGVARLQDLNLGRGKTGDGEDASRARSRPFPRSGIRPGLEAGAKGGIRPNGTPVYGRSRCPALAAGSAPAKADFREAP